jgi:ribosomal protein L32
MGPQPENRPLMNTHTRVGESNYNPRDALQQNPTENPNHNAPVTPGGGFDGLNTQRTRFQAPLQEEGRMPNGDLASSPSGAPSGNDQNDGSPRRQDTDDLAVRGGPGQSSSGPADRSHRICKKCGDPLPRQFVRGLGGTFHLECFYCQVLQGKILTCEMLT